MEKFTVEVEEDIGVYHIRGVHNMQNTLCGFVDVSNNLKDAQEYPCNCHSCISALRDIKALRFPKGYFVGDKE